MKQYTFSLLFLFILQGLFAQAATNLETQINFDLSLKDIVLLVESGKSSEIDMNKYIILEGVVTSREVLFADEENFEGRLGLSLGEWMGLEDIAVYQCFIQLQGLEFADRIPVRRSRNPNPAEISMNTRILVLGKYLGYSEDEEGNKYPVIKGYKIRKIE